MIKSLLKALPPRGHFLFLEQSALCYKNQPVSFFMVKNLVYSVQLNAKVKGIIDSQGPVVQS